MDATVPQISTIDEIYADHSGRVLEGWLTRWKNLIATFKKEMEHTPDFVARSPGRVNIIGEHVDYSLYNVLPTAVINDVLVAVKVVPTDESGPKVKIANINGEKYPSQTFNFPANGDIDIDPKKHEWTNYFKAGIKGSLEFLHKREPGYSPVSMEVMMDGNVPAGGGLSSSAALVCASALAVMHANDHDVSKKDLLDLAVVSERAVGVFSGGMDQAASIFSKKGYLLYCRFFPSFSAQYVPVPDADPEITFVIAQSFVTSDKAVTAPKHYNLRVVECTLAAVMLAKKHSITLNTDQSPLGFSIRQFQEEYCKKAGVLETRPMRQMVEDIIERIDIDLDKKDGYTEDDIAINLGISVKTLQETYFSKFPVQADRFMLNQRASHVVREAKRVLDFRETLEKAEQGGHHLDESVIKSLGSLMNDTQASCRDLYECSCPEIDDMCKIARSAGAIGSRLTGAGWGGCTVHMVPESKVDDVIGALKEKYYSKRYPDISESKLNEAIVISQPGYGSSIISGAALEL